jgi:hypothetical protein
MMHAKISLSIWFILAGNELAGNSQKIAGTFLKPSRELNIDQLPISFNVSFTHDGHQIDTQFFMDSFAPSKELHILDGSEQSTRLAAVRPVMQFFV